LRDQRFPTARKYKLFRRFWHCALTVLPLPQQLEAPVRNGRLGHLRTKGVTSSQSLYLETENNSVTNHLAVLRLPTVVPSICTHVTVERQTRRQGSMSISIGAGPCVCRLRRARVGANRRRRRALSRGRARRPSSNRFGVTRTGLMPAPP